MKLYQSSNKVGVNLELSWSELRAKLEPTSNKVFCEICFKEETCFPCLRYENAINSFT